MSDELPLRAQALGASAAQYFADDPLMKARMEAHIKAEIWEWLRPNLTPAERSLWRWFWVTLPVGITLIIIGAYLGELAPAASTTMAVIGIVVLILGVTFFIAVRGRAAQGTQKALDDLEGLLATAMAAEERADARAISPRVQTPPSVSTCREPNATEFGLA